MIRRLINTIEEKYVFNVAQFFWHIFVALAAIGIVGGVLLLLWGTIPAFKSSVEKAPYPPMVTVSADEVKAFLAPQKYAERTPQRQQETPPPVQGSVSSEASPEERAYRAAVDTMMTLIPPAKYSWGADGYWDYPYGPNYPQYARWIQKEPPVLDKVESAFSQMGVHDFGEKKQLLDAHIAVVRSFKADTRMRVWRSLITWSEPSLSQAIANARLLGTFVPKVSTERSDYITKLATFGNKNPRDGYAFVEYLSATIDSFPAEIRYDMMSALINAYYQYFNNRVQQQIEMTNAFLPMRGEFATEHIIKALDAYYRVASGKNYERNQSIAAIEYNYQEALQQAEAEYAAARAKKAGWRLNGLYSIAGGIAVMATIALILVLLSIQRYVRQIDAKLAGSSRT